MLGGVFYFGVLSLGIFLVYRVFLGVVAFRCYLVLRCFRTDEGFEEGVDDTLLSDSESSS